MQLEAAGDFVINPLRALNVAGEIIEPTRYQGDLRSSYAVMYYTLAHWSVGDGTIGLNLVGARMIGRPRATPLKRTKQVDSNDPWSPSKRGRCV